MQKLFALYATAVIALLAFSSPNEFIVTGKITDDAGKPLASVSVLIKGNKTVGARSDANGAYSIKVATEKTILIFSAMGFEQKTTTVGDKRIINVKLRPTAILQEEVVVVGYETVKRKDITGAVSSVSANQIYGARSAQSLSGRIAGLQVTNHEQQSITYDDLDREGYDYIKENSFLKVKDNPLSTFSIDVDAASYSNIRRFINNDQLPPAGAVRIEEMINYFKYDYPQPKEEYPFSVNTEIAICPWNNEHRLALIGLQGKTMPVENLPASNIVFLIDVSGSMMSYDKLPLVKQSMKLLADQLREQDNVAITVYAGNAGLVLPSTSGANKNKIKDAINALEAGGSTAGGAGIRLAYKTARANFKEDGNNRVILCTDGDFNVGASSDDELERMIEKERESGVFLTVLGFGTGNYQDAKMQKLADKGNGNHGYIDQLSEAKKILVNEFGGTLFTIAKDVKLQVEFNPALVQGYRLIGYENRMLSKEDFNDDKKDAGELGSGHTVTALYEIIPTGVRSTFLQKVDSLKYQDEGNFGKSSFSNELMTVKLRYKQPDGNSSKLIIHPVTTEKKRVEKPSDNFRFAAAVAEFGMLLRNSEFKQHASFENVLSLANTALGKDKDGYRKEFVELVEEASGLMSSIEPKEGDVSKIGQ